MTTVPSRREFDIDFFRGIVCLCLAVLHFYNSALYDTFQNLFGEAGKYIVWNLRFGVESFFVLAGFMMAHMLRPVPGEQVAMGGYLKRRFWRLIVPYWTAVLIYAAYRWGIFAVLKRGEGPLSATDIVTQMFLVQEFFYDSHEAIERVSPIGYWSMVTLEQFYLVWLGLYAVVLAVLGRSNGIGYARAERVMAFLTFGAFLASLSTWVLHIHLHFQILPYSCFLCLGLLLYWSQRQRFVRIYFWLAIPVLLAAAIYTNVSMMWKALITVGLFIPLSQGVRIPRNMVLRFLSYCGQRSYSIYLIHPIAGIAFISMTWKLTAKNEWFAIPILIGAVVISLLAAFVFYRFVEQPCQSMSRKVEYRRRAAPATAAKTERPEPVRV